MHQENLKDNIYPAKYVIVKNPVVLNYKRQFCLLFGLVFGSDSEIIAFKTCFTLLGVWHMLYGYNYTVLMKTLETCSGDKCWS